MLPGSTGTGGCASSTTEGLALITCSASRGLLAFEATPTECTTGVSTAGIEGAVFLNG